MSDRPACLSPADLAALAAAQTRRRRAEAEQRAAQAALELSLLDFESLLQNIQETYGIEQGDRLNPTTGAILRAGPVEAGAEPA